MAANKSNPNAQLLEELEALSESLYKPNTSTTTARRTASLVLPRTSVPIPPAQDDDHSHNTTKVDAESSTNKLRSRARRMSLSPWRSRPKLEEEDDGIESAKEGIKKLDVMSTSGGGDNNEKKGIWKWKPLRALSHIGMQKLSCLFSVEVVTAQGLPSSMNGLRLSVCVRKKETKEGAVKTMPSRVAQGAADFEETLFIRCHAYYSHGGSGKQKLKFEPRPFSIYLFAVDAQELDFGRSSVDLSELIGKSIEENQQGSRVRQWDTSFGLLGKAKGGELVLKLGFQIMEKDGGVEIYSPVENSKSSKLSSFSSSFARKQSKSSFSMPSPRMASRNGPWTPSQAATGGDIQGMDDLNLDDPNPVQDSSSSIQKVEESKEQEEDSDLPDFEVVDKGVEVQEKEDGGGEESEEPLEAKSAASGEDREVVKEIVHDHLHLNRLSELDSIAQQIKALESMMGEDDKFMKIEDETESQSQRLDADEETVTREFLQMLEDQDSGGYSNLFNQPEIPPLQLEEGNNDSSADDGESNVYLPDLGKGLGCVVQTRDGGFLASMNPLDTAVSRKDTPKLAMQMSKPFVLASHESLSGFELFQKLAGIGLDELSSQVLSLMPIDELMGKTAEQVAFEGIASAIIQGRSKEGASSSAARIVSSLKSMGIMMSSGRKERISTGLWNVDEESVTAEKLLTLSMQKIESMTVEALKIQADMAEEEAPFDVSALSSKKGDSTGKDLLASAVSLEDWIRDQSHNKSAPKSESEPERVTLILVVQVRDPIRRYEAVGGPVMVVIHATSDNTKGNEEEKRFKVMSMHVGGFKVRSATKKNAWDSEKHRLTAIQWLVAHGLGKAGKKGKQALAKGQDLLWSISSRIVADMWLKTMRNPDVKLVK
ncbi:protein PLASTID MOVEMENT IMPAIRED 1-like [Lotus japonicus]|uniref:protein PLASTID MOVEMENT IMPAIRED 1-like n=1 Tax=Lotus japonicus TaxID=34305 RepID=UPI00259048F9|nr:protein PLASTID MOVEMENT IMPAIRED 1-like [Lotus japonicus]